MLQIMQQFAGTSGAPRQIWQVLCAGEAPAASQAQQGQEHPQVEEEGELDFEEAVAETRGEYAQGDELAQEGQGPDERHWETD